MLAYTAANTLQLSVAGGSPVTSDSPQAQIPYGAYQVVVIDNASDLTDPAHMFQLVGPGVELGTDLQQGDDKSEIYNETLAANSTYAFSDRALPALAPIVFHTSATPVSPSTHDTVPHRLPREDRMDRQLELGPSRVGHRGRPACAAPSRLR